MALASSSAFGSLPIFGKYAYAAGLSPQQLLAFRFLVSAAAVVFLGALLGERLTSLPARKVAGLLLMGAAGYYTASMTFFVALETLPASLCELVQFIYPALVAIEAWLFFGRPLQLVQGVALVLSITGAVLLVGAVSVRVNVALVLILITPVAYSFYLVAGERVMTDVPALTSSAIVMLGAGISFAVTAAVTGQLKAPSTGAQWSLLLATTLITGIIAVPLLLTALPRIGAGPASVIGLAEPAVTVGLAAALLGERLRPLQVLGALLVLVAIVVLQLPRRPA
jgi:drug/metabolite transporter (DMT)-like permease